MNCKSTFFTAIAMLWGSMALSQQDSITVEYDTLPEWDEKIEQYFGLLDTADITTGFHTDRGFFWIKPDGYNGTDTSSSLQHFGHWRSLYAGVMSSAISEQYVSPHWDEWEDQLNNQLVQGIVPIPIIDYTCQKFLEDSAQLFQFISLDSANRLHDISGTGSP